MRTIAEVKWIKLATGLPDNRKIKQMRKLPQGDTIALLWVFLMCLAGETNDDGAVYFMPEIPYTDEMLADQFGMDVNTVRLGLATFQRFGMIEIVDDIIHLDAWEKWQSVDKLSEIREKNRKRVAKHREKKRFAAGNADCNVTGNVTVMLGNAIDIDLDKDREIEKEKEEDKKIYIDVVEYLNEKAGTNYRASAENTKKLIRARLAEGFTLEDFKTVIDNKCADWLNTDYAKFLRPGTLFQNSKFEGYLNQKGVGNDGRNQNGFGGRPSESNIAGRVGQWF